MVPLASSNSESPTHGPGGERPVGDAEFAQLVDRLGPFERTPHIAAGVSGGADSLALALLAAPPDTFATLSAAVLAELSAMIEADRSDPALAPEIARVGDQLKAIEAFAARRC